MVARADCHFPVGVGRAVSSSQRFFVGTIRLQLVLGN